MEAKQDRAARRGASGTHRKGRPPAAGDPSLPPCLGLPGSALLIEASPSLGKLNEPTNGDARSHMPDSKIQRDIHYTRVPI